jgi:sugar lactone lactonase YvrE
MRDESVFVEVEPGMTLHSSVPGEQDMVVRRLLGLRIDEQRHSPADAIFLPGFAAGPQTYIVDAYCLNFHKDNPSSTTAFSLGDPASPAIVAILDAVDRVPGAERSIDAIQAAIWRVTDHATWQEMADRGYAPNRQMVAALLLSASLDQECALLFGQACEAPPCSSPTNPTGLGASGGQPCVSRVWQPDAASFTPTPEPTTTILDAQVQRFFAPGPGAVALTVAGDTLWIADKDQQRIHHLDQAGASLGSFPIEGEGEPRGLAWDGEALWLLLSDYSQGNRLLRLDAEGSVLSSFDVPAELRSLSWDPVDGAFWAIPSRANGFLLELNADGSLRRTLPIPVFGGAEAIAWAPDGLWVLNVFGTWHRFTIDGAYLASAKLPVEVFASNPALSWDPRGYLWLSVSGTREIYQFSLREAAVDAELPPEMQSQAQQRAEGQFPLPPAAFQRAPGSNNALAQVVNGLPAKLAVALDNDQGGAVHESAVLAPGESWSAIVPQGGVFMLFLSANAPQPVAYSDKVLLLPGYEYTWTIGNAVANSTSTPTSAAGSATTPTATPTAVAPTAAATSTPEQVPATPTPPPSQAAPTPTVAPTRPPAPPPAVCPNPQARITSPANGATISGITPFIGTANLDNLAYYKFEYKPADSPTWQYLTQVNETPISNGKLMDFYTTTIAPGVYDFRLIVVDRTGNYPLPCELRLTIQS